MAKANIPFLAFNRGLISPKALARVDVDRTKLSAEVMTNWLPKKQGAMTIRPGTKYLGRSYNDTGAEWIEFVAATDDTALIELTHQKMRVWIDDALLGRPKVDTTLSISDTGWINTSTGGSLSTPAEDVIPVFASYASSVGTISASSEQDDQGGVDRRAWRAADDSTSSKWYDTGADQPSTLPSWWRVDFGSGNSQAITSYSIRSGPDSPDHLRSPQAWTLERSDDGSSWTAEDSRSGVNSWALSERKTYSVAAADTGTVEARRYWRLNFTAQNDVYEMRIAEIEMFANAAAQQVKLQGGRRILNPTSIGALARAEKRVIVSDTGTEHSLSINIRRGPVVLRVGSTQRADDYINETSLGTGYHNLAFTPTSNFWVTLQNNNPVDRIVDSIGIGDSGTVEVTTFLDASDLSNVRYDQSADVVYLDASTAAPCKIERRGTGRSWSFVRHQPKNGPFLAAASSSANLSVSDRHGNTTLNSDIPFFSADHAEDGGALFRLFHGSQSGRWPLGALNAVTDAIRVTGLSDTGDTGTPTQGSERRIGVSVTGTYVGTIQLERSFEGAESGFHPVSISAGYIKSGSTASDTGTFVRVINDPDDNAEVWYRARMSAYTSGAAIVTLTYPHGGVYGVGRVTAYNSNTDVDIEVLSRFSDTGPTTSWQEGSWSSVKGYPGAIALHAGRLAHAGDGNFYASVSDDYENYDDQTEGDAGPLNRTIGSGPVDNIYYLISLLRLIVGTSGAEMSVRSSSLDEPLTPQNAGIHAFSTQGSANLRALKMDNSAVFVQRSGKRLFKIAFGQGVDALGDYEVSELTSLTPDLMAAGVVSIAIQRQPDTRIHCVLGNGQVAILTYEPKEEVLCWSLWETDGLVERAMTLPGTGEDKVYYHVNRTIGGVTRRFLERWATEDECQGDTGLSWLADCAVSFTDTGRATLVTGADHLVGESVVVWGDDTGQSAPGIDYSPDVAGVQTTYTVDTGGDVTLTSSVHHAVVGLPYAANWKSAKLAYAAEFGTALAQKKRAGQIAFSLYNTHNNGLFFGSDTGNLDALPRVFDKGASVNNKRIFATIDAVAMPFPGLWDEDSRIHLRAKAPRPVTVLAAIPNLQTSEKV